MFPLFVVINDNVASSDCGLLHFFLEGIRELCRNIVIRVVASKESLIQTSA